MSRPGADLRALKRISECPEYVASEAELQRLSSALAHVSTAIEDLEQQLRAQSVSGAGNLIEDALHFSATGELRQPSRISSLQEQHVALRRQREAVEEAIRAKHQEQVQIVSELSAQQCRNLEAIHRKLATRYLAALRELDALHEEEEAMFNTIRGAGYRVCFRRPIAWPLIGTIKCHGEAPIWSHYRDVENYASDPQ